MDRLAYIFPGQGVQKVGMGKDVYEAHPLAKEIFDRANEILKFDLTKLIFSGPAEELSQTKNTQPAVFMVNIVYMKLLNSFGFKPEITAGHSLGEYSAYVAADVIPWEKALVLVRKRGELMDSGQGKMAAVLGLESDIIKDVCFSVKNIGVVEPVNYNAPGQVVISGETKAIEAAGEELKKKGARRVIFLETSGPFHSSLMSKAASEFSVYLDSVEFSQAKVPVVSNVTGKPLTDPKEIKESLSLQIKSPVFWDKSMKYILDTGVKNFIEVGPGNVLRGLLKKIDSTANVVCMDEKWKDLLK